MKPELRVLIAEDSEDDALLLLMELRAAGFEPVWRRVETEDALRASLRDESWDVVISDYSMPGFSGLEVISCVHDNGKDIPIIIVSGVIGEDLAVAAMKAGAHDYLIKGKMSRLIPAVKRELREAEMRRAHRRAEADIRRLTAVLKTLAEINILIARHSDRKALFDDTAATLVRHGMFNNACICAYNREDGSVIGQAYCGSIQECGGEGGRGCECPVIGKDMVVEAASGGVHAVWRDNGKDGRFANVSNAALKYWYRTCGAFPLSVRGSSAGVIVLTSPDPDVFSDEVVGILDELAGNVGHALQAFDEARQRLEADARFRASERKFRNLIEALPIGIVVLGAGNEIIEANPAMLQMTGYSSKEEFAGVPRESYYHDPRDRQRYYENLREDAPSEIELILRRKDGALFWANITAVYRTAGDGGRYLLNIIQDVTSRKLAEDALIESEERFRQIFEQSQDAQVIFEYGARQIIDANAAAMALFGFTRDELMDSDISVLTGGQGLNRFADTVKGVSVGGSFGMERMESRKKDGKKITVSIKGQRIRLMQSDVIYCTVRDISDVIRMEEESRVMQAKLIHANKMTSLGTLASGVAHEINNPNNYILFNASILSGVWRDVGKILEAYYEENGDFTAGGLPYTDMRRAVPELLSGIGDGARRVKGIIDNLRDFSMPDTSDIAGSVDVNSAVRASASILQHEIVKYTDRFETLLDCTVPPVAGSAQKIEQVLINLIMNALHALPDRGRGVCVSTGYDGSGNFVTVKIRDEGSGMSHEVLERITEPFFTTKSAIGGTGLGLSISYSIVTEHKGYLEFDSKPGAGTAVIVRLPAAAAADPAGRKRKVKKAVNR